MCSQEGHESVFDQQKRWQRAITSDLIDRIFFADYKQFAAGCEGGDTCVEHRCGVFDHLKERASVESVISNLVG